LRAVVFYKNRLVLRYQCEKQHGTQVNSRRVSDEKDIVCFVRVS